MKTYSQVLKEAVASKIGRFITEEEPKVKIPVEHEGVLEVPEGKDVQDMSLDHFKKLADKKGYAKIAHALTNLIVWNKEKNPSLSKWADSMQNKLKAWHDSKEE